MATAQLNPWDLIMQASDEDLVIWETADSEHLFTWDRHSGHVFETPGVDFESTEQIGTLRLRTEAGAGKRLTAIARSYTLARALVTA